MTKIYRDSSSILSSLYTVNSNCFSTSALNVEGIIMNTLSLSSSLTSNGIITDILFSHAGDCNTTSSVSKSSTSVIFSFFSPN